MAEPAMCFNISVARGANQVQLRFGAAFEDPNAFREIYHAAAYSDPTLPVITGDRPDRISMLKWGLVPRWAKDEALADRLRVQTINARAETIMDKPSFKQSIVDRRCLVLADGFYEWREVGGRKYPYYIKLKGHGLFAIAGIWDEWKNPKGGDKYDGFSVITTKANPLLEMIHNTKKRMPVILPRGEEKHWLESGLRKEELMGLLAPYDDKLMEAHPVSKLIVSRDRDTNVPEAQEPFDYPELGQRTLF